MKKSVVLFTMLLAILFSKANAQNPLLKIATFADSSYSYPCTTTPYISRPMFWGTATNVSFVYDTLDYKIFWGDGDSLVSFIPIQANQGTAYFGCYNDTHLYQFPGIYSLIMSGKLRVSGLIDTIKIDYYKIIGTHCDSIYGQGYIDQNNNCIKDVGESGIGGQISIYYNNHLINNTMIYNYPNYNRWFSYIPAGFNGTDLWKIKYFWNNSFIAHCPASGEYSFADVTTSTNPMDFGITCNANNIDNSIGFNYAIAASINNRSNISFVLNGLSCSPNNGIIKLAYPHGATCNWGYHGIFPINISQTPVFDTITFGYSNLQPFISKTYYLEFTHSPQLVLNDTIRFFVKVISDSPEIVLNNNVDSIKVAVRSSFDPNDIQVNPMRFIPNMTKLSYYVRFQNTGNAPAYKVVVIDTLNANLDINTVEFKGSKHQVDIEKLPGNILKFNFDPIYLPDSGDNMQGSQGHFAFTVKPVGYLPIGTQIPNRAFIYFDNNPYVETNTVINVIDSVKSTVGIEDSENSIPVGRAYFDSQTSKLILNLNEKPQQAWARIYDSKGALIQSSALNNQYNSIVMGKIQSGIYFVELKNNQKIIMQKIYVIKP